MLVPCGDGSHVLIFCAAETPYILMSRIYSGYLGTLYLVADRKLVHYQRNSVHRRHYRTYFLRKTSNAPSGTLYGKIKNIKSTKEHWLATGLSGYWPLPLIYLPR